LGAIPGERHDERRNMTDAKRYEEWIRTRVRGGGNGLCWLYARAMAHHFPELRPAMGEYVVKDQALGHFWCVTVDGYKPVDLACPHCAGHGQVI
jgi:hypothetical protein